jgi:hypothetical protein
VTRVTIGLAQNIELVTRVTTRLPRFSMIYKAVHLKSTHMQAVGAPAIELVSRTSVGLKQVTKESASQSFQRVDQPLVVFATGRKFDTGPQIWFDLMKTLVNATGWDLQQALDMWLALCAEHPQFHNCWMTADTTTAYVTQDQLRSIYEIEPAVEWADCVIGYTEQSEIQAYVDDGRLTAGIFYPLMQWAPPRECHPSKLVWMETFVDENGTMFLDLDRVLQTKYSLGTKEASALRLRHMAIDNDLALVVFKTILEDEKVLWCVHMADISKVIMKFTRKRNAEAERMHEHKLAQFYVTTRACDVEVECQTCESVDLVNISGQRTRELRWQGFALDVGISFGNEVVGAIEILNTSRVSAKKIRALKTEGVPFAEVKAMDVISAFRDKVSVIKAVRGYGFCKQCKQGESAKLLSCELAQCEERERQNHKNLREIGIEKDDIRRKIRKLDVDLSQD